MHVLNQNISSMEGQTKREYIATYYVKKISKTNDFTFLLKTHLNSSDEGDFNRLVISTISTSLLPMDEKAEWFF